MVHRRWLPVSEAKIVLVKSALLTTQVIVRVPLGWNVGSEPIVPMENRSHYVRQSSMTMYQLDRTRDLVVLRAKKNRVPVIEKHCTAERDGDFSWMMMVSLNRNE